MEVAPKEMNIKDENHKIFYPTMKEVTELAKSISLDALTNNQVTNRLMKRVKLSDSAMGLIIQLRVTCVKSRDWYPLNFNALSQDHLDFTGNLRYKSPNVKEGTLAKK